MNRECLHIKNLGPVREIDLQDIRRLNVFIGESGCGKSTVMKVLAMCRWLYKMHCIRSYLKHSGIKISPFRIRGVLSTNGLDAFVRPDSIIEYSYGEFSCGLTGGKLTMSRSLIPVAQLSLEKIAYVSDKRMLLPDIISGGVSLRHGMYYLEDTLSNFQKAMDVIASTDLPYLGVRMDVRKTSVGRRVFVSSLGKNDGFYNLPLKNASSGMQSCVGLHFILNYFANKYNLVEAINTTVLGYLSSTDRFTAFKPITDIGAFPKRRMTMLVEEPELSLFPSNQYGLIDYMVGLMARGNDTQIDLVFATHSPYVLTALNVLMLAHRAAVDHPDKVDSIMGDRTRLDSAMVSAWQIKDGTATDLLDSETGLIDGSWLDSASDIFDEQIYQLNQLIYG